MCSKHVKEGEQEYAIIHDTPPPDGAMARGGPWPPLRYASRPLDSLLCLSIRLPIFLRSMDVSSSYLIFGLPLRLIHDTTSQILCMVTVTIERSNFC